MTQTNNAAVETSRSLKNLAFKGAAWTLGGYAAAQLLRLASNIILAKLLFPEAFGLMVLVTIFMQGIAMFSDIGIVPSIIQNKRGDDPTFLNTAWTIQVIRGFLIWIVACIGTYPYAKIYDEPLLLSMIPIAGLSAIIAGFNSTSLATANRKLNLGRITLLELITQAIAIAVMVSWVFIQPTVWGLVAGGLVGALVKMVLSHLWFDGISNKFCWDKDAAGKLFSFGRWILISTALTFFAAQIDRLLLGSLMGVASLGIYSIAALFRESISQAIQKLGSMVLFPSLSEIVRSGNDAKLYSTLRKTRIAIIAAMFTGSLVLLLLGPKIIMLLYDNRYSDAAWMLEILALSGLIGCVSLSYQNVFLAKGKSNYITAILAIQILIQLSAIVLGYYLNGLLGLVIGLSLVSWLLYPANAIAAKKLSLWQPEIDFPVIILALIVTSMLYQFNFSC